MKMPPNKFYSLRFLAMVSLLAISCEEDRIAKNNIELQSGEPMVINGRMTFQSKSQFLNTIRHINELSQAEQKNWISRYDFKPLVNLIDTASSSEFSMKRLPNSYQMVLNQAAEVEIGDTILWYTPDGTILHFPKHNQQSLFNAKRGDTNGVKKSSFVVRPQADLYDSEGRVLVQELDARYQFEFQPNYDDPKRKFVHELYVFWDSNNYYSELYLRIKMERWGKINAFKRGWKPCADHRDISWSFTYNAYLVWGTRNGAVPTTYYGSKYDSYYGTSDQNIYIGSDYLTYSEVDKSWSVEISGTIFQHVPNDSPSNAYTTTGYPLW